MTITVGRQDQQSLGTATIRWTAITPFVSACYTVKVAVPGGDGMGRVYRRGHDNAVATLTGLLKRDAQAEAFLKALTTYRLKITDSTTNFVHYCMADTPTITESNAAWIKISISLTEVMD